MLKLLKKLHPFDVFLEIKKKKKFFIFIFFTVVIFSCVPVPPLKKISGSNTAYMGKESPTKSIARASVTTYNLQLTNGELSRSWLISGLEHAEHNVN